MYYLLSHPSLWPHVILIFLIQITIFTICYILFLPINIAITVVFTLIFPPLSFVFQVGSFLIIKVWSSKIGRKLVYKRKVLNSTFDAVLIKEGYQEMVLRGKFLKKVKVSKGGSYVIKAVDLPFAPKEILNYFSAYIGKFAFLIAFPPLAQVTFMLTRGLIRGQKAHKRYFDLRGIDYRQRNKFLTNRRTEYSTFGTVAGFLIHIPFHSAFFQVATSCGAALWAIEMEQKRKRRYNGKKWKVSKSNFTKKSYKNNIGPFILT